ncbi:MAG: hypothetical protein E2O42_06160 [Nitrospina sp.]|nr:MAG: hypothetical protein E2O42_06160 [Nitrospina sp.]
MAARQIIKGIRGRILQLVIGMMLLILPVQAQALLGIGVTGKVGTTGLGADLTVPLIPNWINLRAGYNYGEWRPSTTQGGINYKADVRLETTPLLIDIHPFHGNFRITGGVYLNRTEIDLSSFVDANDVGLGDIFPPGTNVTLNANVSWSKDYAPYFGIGYGNAADANFLDLPIAVGLSIDLGAYYQGSPDVILTESTGTVTPANLAVEAAQLKEDLSEFKFFPVLTIGIHIRF